MFIPNKRQGCRITNSLVVWTLSAIVFLKVTSTDAQIQKGQNIFGDAGVFFGFPVSMPDSNTLAVGVVNNFVSNSSVETYLSVYSWKGYWQQKGLDIDKDTLSINSMYWLRDYVSMPDANTVAIGTPNNSENSNEVGYVRVYSWDGNVWLQKGLDIDGESAFNLFGKSISMPDNNTIAIGSPYNSGIDTKSGLVQIYHWNGSSWQQKGSDIDGEAANDESGWSISMPDNNTIAIGAPYNSESGNNESGHVRIYSWNGNTWQQKGLDIDREVTIVKFGHAVSMPDANTVAIGAYNQNQSSHVRIYSWNGSSWLQKGIGIDGDTLSFGTSNDYSISMSDSNTLAISAQSQVRIFSWNGSNWLQKGRDIDKGFFPTSSPSVGLSVCMPDSNTVALRNNYNVVQVYSLCNTTANISPTACDSFISPSGKRNWKRSGSYKETILNAEGCDSIVSIDLTILNSTSSTDFIAACDSFKWIDNVLYTSSTDTATFTLTSAAGCDSVVTLDLSITSVDTSIIKENDTLIANQSAATYQWLNCDSSFSEVSGENSQSFKPENSGSYACEITLNGCVDTTSCYRVTIASIEEEPLSFEFKIHPNPVGDFLSIEIGSLVQNASMHIRNVNGQLVYENSNLREGNNQVNVSNWAKGVYIVRIIGDDFDKAVKIVKQ